MKFDSYSLFTTTLLLSLSIPVFVILTGSDGILRRIPLSIIYIFLIIIGLRLLIPVEILVLSYEINSYIIMAMIYNVIRCKIFTIGSFGLSVGNVFIIIWVTGICVRLADFGIKYCRFRLAAKQFPQVNDKNILDIADNVCSQLNISKKPKILENKSLHSPSEYGLFRQTVVLNGAKYTDEEMYYILLHEMTHHKLKNDIAKCFAKFLEIVFWWNPVVYMLYDRIDMLMEIYTDAYVTKNFTKQQKYDYLHCLYSVYRTIDKDTILSSAFASPMIGRDKKSEIEKRFGMVVKGRKNNPLMCFFGVVLSLACCLSTMFLVFQPAYQPPAEDMRRVGKMDNDNSYIAKEYGGYVLYYNGEPLVYSDKKEKLEQFIEN